MVPCWCHRYPGVRRALGGQLGQAFGHRCVMTGVEKVAAGFNHGLVIARVAAVFVLTEIYYQTLIKLLA